ncbi:imidazole glycerol phosphate synthase subunit HisH [Flavobacteriaceae bacterium]|nr:imidazole glycerol phosphate synthase subunit HisH [Flavobacteriaceae bacterium]
MTGILNYGMGNILSIKNALTQIEEESIYVGHKDDFSLIDRLIIPGVGSFSDAMNNIIERDLYDSIMMLINQKKPLLGICLGMQLLCQIGEEEGYTKGFSYFEGNVVKFDLKNSQRIPHIGWNSLKIKRDHPILSGVKTEADFYFLHSFHFNENYNVVAMSEYGYEFPAIIAKDNVIGIQFHPEKSQKQGLKILRNFIDIEC